VQQGIIMNVNDKVICIDNISMHEKFKIYYPTIPEKGKVYVIRKVAEHNVPNCPTKTLYFVGVNSKNNSSGHEMGWDSIDFKLLKDCKEKKNMFGGEYDWLNKENE